MRSTLLTALVAGVVFVAGCGGGGNSNVRPDAVVEPPPDASDASHHFTD